MFNLYIYNKDMHCAQQAANRNNANGLYFYYRCYLCCV